MLSSGGQSTRDQRAYRSTITPEQTKESQERFIALICPQIEGEPISRYHGQLSTKLLPGSVGHMHFAPRPYEHDADTVAQLLSDAC